VRILLSILTLITATAWSAESSYKLQVLPPEHKRMVDPITGAELLFLTTAPEKDANLYFHEFSWTADDSVILFTSSRRDGGLMGYITATGELIRFKTPTGSLGGATAAAKDNAIFAMRGREIVRVRLSIQPSTSGGGSAVTANERVICSLPDGSPNTSLNVSCDDKYIALGIGGFADTQRGPAILKVNTQTGELTEVCRFPAAPGYAGHVQWSRTNPNLISFAGAHTGAGDVAGPVPLGTGPEDYATRGQRLWIVDIRSGIPRNIYLAEEGELVTHESWWVKDQMLFCGGKGNGPAVLSHVKAVNVNSGEVRIVGAGAWLPGATPESLARVNWWHASGSADGRWVAADNWHGDVMLFDGKTTRPHLLTSNHRTYGHGEHLHVGWDRKGEKVIFASNMLGDGNVCVATIPKAWQDRLTVEEKAMQLKPK
jgi:oligogalacturonide lyase